MVAEVIEAMGSSLNGTVVDATVGAGGHAAAIMDAHPRVRVIGFDRDPEAIEVARERLSGYGDRVALRMVNFGNLAPALSAESVGEGEVSAILLDLGASGMQLKNAGRGFSFSHEGPLDMRMGPDATDTAESLLGRLDEDAIALIIREYGEDRNARKIARRIVSERNAGSMRSTADLARVAAAVAGGSGGKRGRTGSRAARGRTGSRAARGRRHPATRTFQAVRIAVNDELAAIERVLPQATAALCRGGRMVVISFHSLEDRIVKRFFARESRDCVCPPEMPECRCGHVRSLTPVTRKPVVASPAETASNPEARSAKLRAAERL